MSEELSKEEIIEHIVANTEMKNNKRYLSCKDAFKLAMELNIGNQEIGKICHQQNIKLSNCRLGCF